LEGISAGFLSWCCTVAIICTINLIFVLRANTTDFRWLIDNLLGIWFLIFFFLENRFNLKICPKQCFDMFVSVFGSVWIAFCPRLVLN